MELAFSSWWETRWHTGRHGDREGGESSTACSAGSRRYTGWAYKTLEPAFTVTRFLQQGPTSLIPLFMAKHSTTRVYGSHSYSNHHTVSLLPPSLFLCSAPASPKARSGLLPKFSLLSLLWTLTVVSSCSISHIYNKNLPSGHVVSLYTCNFGILYVCNISTVQTANSLEP